MEELLEVNSLFVCMCTPVDNYLCVYAMEALLKVGRLYAVEALLEVLKRNASKMYVFMLARSSVGMGVCPFHSPVDSYLYVHACQHHWTIATI